jgi:citrate synthase
MGAGRDARRLSTAEAAVRLGVKPATLYAYVSRGLLGRERSSDGRTSTFDPAEIDRLARRGRARRGRRPATDLVVPSALTAIDQGRPWYRGVAVTDLAATRTFEEVAEWLWTGRFPAPATAPGGPALGGTVPAAGPGGPAPWQAAEAALDAGRRPGRFSDGAAAGTDRVIAAAWPPATSARSARPAAAAARSLIAGLVDCLPTPALHRPGAVRRRPPVGGSPLRRSPAVGVLDAAARSCYGRPRLAASTVAARVAASVRADPYAVVSAGLATVSGTLHGGASLGIEALLDEVDRPERAATVVGARLRRGERLRGFGHRLYPDGDPRAGFLLTRLRATAAGSPRMAVVDALLEATTRMGLPEPNVDLALAALAHVTAMTRGAAEAIFAVARTAGWIAHALEEYDRNTPIRPRAVYTGPAPGS